MSFYHILKVSLCIAKGLQLNKYNLLVKT